MKRFLLFAGLALFLFVVGSAVSQDSDGDGMSDAYETLFGLNYTNGLDGMLNYDGDLLLNVDEADAATDPFTSDTDRDGWNDDVDDAPVSRLFVEWGEPLFTDGDQYVYTGPYWWRYACKYGGVWQADPAAWYVSPSNSSDASLMIEVDRSLLSSDAVLTVDLYDHSGSSLYIDLYNTNAHVVASNLCGNILSGTGMDVSLEMTLPLGSYADASGVLLRRGSGEVTVYRTMLYIDKDGDGLDAEQEAQLGTSDQSVDSDGDGIADSDESAALALAGITGGVFAEYWMGIGGTAVSALTGSANYPDSSDQYSLLSQFEIPVNRADNYGSKVSGYVVPPASGDYSFWVAGDDNCELWLSADDSASNKVLIARVPGWTGSRQWNRYADQQSVPIALTGGQLYYIEALHKEGGGGDNLAVAWQGPGITRSVIDGQYLIPNVSGNKAPLISLETSGTMGPAPLTVDFDASGSSDINGDTLSYLWDFGDGTVSAGSSVESHSYTNDGDYTVLLTVLDGNGGVSSESVTVSVDSLVPAVTVPATVAGLNFMYYHGTWGVLPDFEALTHVDSGSVLNIDLSARTQNDNFGFMFDGYIMVPTGGVYTFYTTSDDGSKLYIGGEEVVNNDGLHGMVEKSGSIGLSAGLHPIQITMFERGGGHGLQVHYEGPGIAKQLIPDSAFLRPDYRAADTLPGTKAGLNYRYYHGSWNALPDFEALPHVVSGSVVNVDLSARTQDDNFGFKFDGYINVPTDGFYTFYTSSDDGSKLFIDGVEVVNNDGLHPMVERSGVIGLEAGFHPIEIAFFEKGGGHGLQVRYEGPGMTKQLIPDEAFVRSYTPPLVTYTFTVNGGSGSGEYGEGESIEVSADSAPSGMVFTAWSGDIAVLADPFASTTIAVMGSNDLSVTAEYVSIPGDGEILMERWDGIGGTAIASLTGYADYPDNPSSTNMLTGFEITSNTGDDYGTRVRGYIHPLVSGDYTFWISGDDRCELWLSTDESVSNKVLIANVPGWTPVRNWSKYAEQRSVQITLQAGERYYVEALHKEGGGGDNLAVAWESDEVPFGVVDGAYLSPPAVNPDRDGDGIDDAWEQQIVDADPDDAVSRIEDVLPDDDFDGDGVSNVLEYQRGTDAADASSANLTISVDAATGNDSNDGLSAPFATIGAAIRATVSGDTIEIEAGSYSELPAIYDFEGKSLTLIPLGSVRVE